jgi:N-methylhydantoinase A/oxoprolinase/acetone carboxylase beta subunit
MFIIGVDIGGTNTDAVLIDREKRILARTKVATTADIAVGFRQALTSLFAHGKIAKSEVTRVFVGTTHATNAILERRDLYKVGLIRIAGHHPDSLPPCYDWPQALKEEILVGSVTVGGGVECDGASITPFEKVQVKQAAEALVQKGAESLAVISVFAPIYPEQELEAEVVIRQLLGAAFPCSLSHKIGGIGFIERENSTLLNAALKKCLAKGFQQLQQELLALGIEAPLFISQNNGTVIDLEKALNVPVLTLSAGPTNSFIGAVKLARQENAIVVDIGGTSTDIGMVKNGFPKRSLNRSNIGGVSLNFPMPDVLSIGLGGGSYVRLNPLQVGPKSAARKLLQEALCFGGDQLTLTDIAVRLTRQLIPEAQPEFVPCSEAEALEVVKHCVERIEQQVGLMAGRERDLPVIVVGGGVMLLKEFFNSQRFIIPEDANVANAYGAALAEISGTVDCVVPLTDRENVLKEIQEKCIQEAIKEGADPESTRLVDLQIIPYHYVPGHLARVVATASGTQA